MKRLASAFGIDTGLSRIEQAKALASKLRSTIVLKGAHTVVASCDGRYAVNLSGCPALATAGSGDILSGIIGALLANGQYSAFECARAAVFLHGFTAELAVPLDPIMPANLPFRIQSVRTPGFRVRSSGHVPAESPNS